MIKAFRETQTLRTGCSKAEPQIFVPLQTPFPGVQDGQNLISWRWSLPLPQTQFGEDRCMQFRVIVVTDPQTNKQTGPITIHCTAKLSAQCNQQENTIAFFDMKSKTILQISPHAGSGL